MEKTIIKTERLPLDSTKRCFKLKADWFFIVNPVSGGGQGVALWKKVEAILIENKISFDFAISKHHKHTIEIILEKYAQGIRQFIGIGGDGTLNEIVNGICTASDFNRQEKCTIGLLPIGTGNDWVRGMREPLGLENLITKLKRGEILDYDIGLVSTEAMRQYFINVAGVGLDGQVVHEIERLSFSGKKGKSVYLRGLLRALSRFTASNVHVQIDGAPPFAGKVLVVTASKGAYFGGGMHISPDVLPSSGKLDFTIVKKVPNWKVLPRIYQLFNGRIGQVPFVEKKMGERIEIESESDLLIQADGEFVGLAKKVTFEVIPGAIKALV